MPTNPFYFDVLTLLQNAGFGTAGTDLFGGEWGAPDAQTLVRTGVGFPSPQPEIYEQPAVQILTRGEVIEADIDVYIRAKAISDYLLTQTDSVDINGVCYRGFEEGSTLSALGKDEKERHVYSANYYSWRNRI